MKNFHWEYAYLAFAFMALLLLLRMQSNLTVIEPIPYSQFLQLLDAHKVEDLKIEREKITGVLQEPINGHNQFSTFRVDTPLARELAGADVSFSGVQENTLGSSLLSWLMPLMLVITSLGR